MHPCRHPASFPRLADCPNCPCCSARCSISTDPTLSLCPLVPVPLSPPSARHQACPAPTPPSVVHCAARRPLLSRSSRRLLQSTMSARALPTRLSDAPAASATPVDRGGAAGSSPTVQCAPPRSRHARWPSHPWLAASAKRPARTQSRAKSSSIPMRMHTSLVAGTRFPLPLPSSWPARLPVADIAEHATAASFKHDMRRICSSALIDLALTSVL